MSLFSSSTIFIFFLTLLIVTQPSSGDDKGPDESSSDWKPLDYDDQVTIDVVGWVVAALGFAILLICAAALCAHYFTALPAKHFQQKTHLAVSLILKALLLPALLFRAMSVVGAIYWIVPGVIRCQDFYSSCISTYFVIDLVFIVPTLCLNLMFLLLCFFWRWLLQALVSSSPSFDLGLLEWKITSGAILVLTVLSFMLSVILDDEMPLLAISWVLQFLILCNLVGFGYYGVRLWMQMKSFAIISDTNKKLFLFSLIVLVFQFIHLVTVQIFNFVARKEINAFDWCLSYILWALISEFLPEALLVLFLYPKGVWPLPQIKDTYTEETFTDPEATDSINYSTGTDIWLSE